MSFGQSIERAKPGAEAQRDAAAARPGGAEATGGASAATRQSTTEFPTPLAAVVMNAKYRDAADVGGVAAAPAERAAVAPGSRFGRYSADIISATV
jgi:hypothetical protein